MNSFWDRVRPTPALPRAVAVDLSADRCALSISWDDGVTTRAGAQALRQNCPCASCVDEWTRRRTLDATTVPENLRVLEIRPVGNYALGFTFSDAHQSGIFDWALLRQLGAQRAS